MSISSSLFSIVLYSQQGIYLLREADRRTQQAHTTRHRGTETDRQAQQTQAQTANRLETDTATSPHDTETECGLWEPHTSLNPALGPGRRSPAAIMSPFWPSSFQASSALSSLPATVAMLQLATFFGPVGEAPAFLYGCIMGMEDHQRCAHARAYASVMQSLGLLSILHP